MQTKLLFPRPRRALVPRPRLSDALHRGRDAALILVSAPAGFGKTTLLAAALQERIAEGPNITTVAWVSLDPRDGDAARFWTYALQALDVASPGCAAAALSQLEGGQSLLADVITSLINELSVRPDDVTLVLDDYHLADTPDVGDALSFLLDHRPPQLHLIISTRADPALPLPRLRARGELVEIRASDLRFTADEAETYLNTVHDLRLSASAVDALESRTEGWVAALQLAALSLHGHDDAASFIATFAGDDRFVVDYLVDEVLDQQPATLRRFLLDTSVLDRLSGALCDAVTAGSGGRGLLETLERRNLLLIPLDDQRHWYRYHHLFADVLLSRLLAERPEDVPELHRRASRWYEQAGHPEPAVRHAFAAGDVDLAADLIEVAAPSLRRHRAEGTLRSWLSQLPPAVLDKRPVLANEFIGALMSTSSFEDVGDRLDALERSLAAAPDMFVIRNDAEWRRLPAVLAMHRAAFALVKGDHGATIAHAETALARATADDQLTVGGASAIKGLAAWSAGDLASALKAYRISADCMAAAGYISDVLGCTVTLVDLELQLGRLDQAHRAAARGLELAGAAGDEGVVRGTADMWVALARVAWERGDTVGAEENLNRASDLGESAGLPQQPYRWRVAMAHLREAQGDVASADTLLCEAERLFNSDFSPVVRPIPAVRARLHIHDGDLAAARSWATSAGVAAADEVTYLREYEHVTLARLLLAEHADTHDDTHLSQALSLLERLHRAADAGGRTAVVVETMVLQAVAHDRAERTDEAVRRLMPAVELAQPRGWVRPFTSEGRRVRELLTLLPRSESGFARTVDAAVGGHPAHIRAQSSPAANVADVPVSVPGPSAEPLTLVAALSSREQDVLRLLASDLDGPSIARHLNVSLATVRTHTQHIYAKLGVNNRRAAVRRGHQLNL
ncbi:LuxR C-terminal-related transcriptional regulator [Nocardioides sp. GCM10028917]|uniref:LuxR C-terminal-related transcriptional regulator n=1 Tax=Nocardioides sp. GCM10028917 TaxID=3273408 RepID=UPI0036204243